jgi:predicted DNA-binding WGR domain protein
MNPDRNEQRWYYLGWQASLLDEGGVVRFYGRKGGFQRQAPWQQFTSLAEAWPFIRRQIRARLRRGYIIVAGTRPDQA